MRPTLWLAAFAAALLAIIALLAPDAYTLAVLTAAAITAFL